MTHPTALIADDEPLLRERLTAQLGRLWPELEIVAQARNGREAVALFEQHQPDVVFLDIHMPGQTGIEAARSIARRAQVVFITAYDRYAVEAFEHGAIDYIVKPTDDDRLADTVQRLRSRVGLNPPAPAALDAVLDRLSQVLQEGPAARRWLQWIKASVGPTVRLIPVEDVDYLRSDEKYTLVAWRGDDGKPGEALVRLALKDLVAQLDPAHFAQVHRSVVVNLRAISHVTRGENETADIHLKGRTEVLPVSRSYLHLFRQM